MPSNITINTAYDYDTSGRLIRETILSCYTIGNFITTEKLYLYDESGVIGMIYTDNDISSTYYFDRNIRGDVIGIFDSTGTRIAKYSYDAWGNCTISSTTNSTIANANPFRYRGYYYDRETKFYYLNARYYNPECRRFISPDSTEYIDPENPNGLNLYVYCNNDPVNYADPSGHSIILSIFLGAIIGGVISAIFETSKQIKQHGWDPDDWDGESIGLAFLGGFVSGAITAIPVPGFAALGSLGRVLSYAGTFALGAAGTLASGAITGSIDFSSVKDIVLGIMIGGSSNVLARGISELILSYQTTQIMRLPKKAKSLHIQDLQGKAGNPAALKGRMRNAFKNYSRDQVMDLINKTNPWIKYGIYASVNSAWMSSLPY